MELGGGYWLHAERIIPGERKTTVSNVNHVSGVGLTFAVVTTVERPMALEDINDVYMQPLDYQSLPWEWD